jgi:P27 family predicted phage terminase small subunit
LSKFSSGFLLFLFIFVKIIYIITKKPMGRNKLPTEIKELRGTDRADRDAPNRLSLTPEEGIPSPPIDMGEHAKILWKQITAELYSLGMLARVSSVQIEQYCNNYEIYRQAFKQTDYGRVLFSGTRKHPAFTVMMEAQKAMRQFEDRYGLNPSYASRIKTAVSKKAEGGKEYDEFEDV